METVGFNMGGSSRRPNHLKPEPPKDTPPKLALGFRVRCERERERVYYLFRVPYYGFYLWFLKMVGLFGCR